jgi:apolipoprotein N-acyltransferase
MLRQIKLPSYPVTQLRVLKGLFLCFLSAVLLILSFPRLDFEFLVWVGFVPLFITLRNKSKGKAFLFSYLTGVIFWLGIIYWLVHVTLPGMIVLVLYLALYFGLFGFIISTINHEPSTMNLLFIPSLWVILEYIRSHLFTGFPWVLLGYSQYLNLPIIQIADIAGAWGVSFLVMMVNVTLYSAVSCQLSAVSKIKKCLVPILCLLVVIIYGYYKLSGTRYPLPGTSLKISVIQGNIPQELKWDSSSKEYILEKYFHISSQAAKDKPDLIIWPEAAMPVVVEEEPLFFEKVRDFVKMNKRPLLFGAVTAKDNFYYNSAFLLSERANLVNRYDKLHLVPFGEYIPLRKTLWFLETIVPIGDFSPGEEYTVFQVPSTLPDRQAGEYQVPSRFSVLICFEDLFPQLSREFSRRGADFLVNITNDAWFKISSSPYQHLQASVFRAVENRLPLVRAANTGVSGFIAPSGKILSLLQDKSGRNIFISGYDTREIIIQKRKASFYTRHGDIFVVICFLSVLYTINSKRKT